MQSIYWPIILINSSSYFCNSDKKAGAGPEYLDIVTDKAAKAFVTTFYDLIEQQTRLFLAKMDKGEIE